MALSRRTRRRLLLLALIVVVLSGIAIGAKLLLDWRRTTTIEAARSEGFQAYERGDHATVLEALGPLIRQSPDDLELLRAVAFSRIRLKEPDGGHLPRAAVLFQRVLELDPEDIESTRELMEIYPRLGFLRETLDTAASLLELVPGDPEAMEAKVRVLAAMGRWAEASETAASLVASDPDSEKWKQLQVATALASGMEVEEVVELARAWPKASFDDGLDDLVIAALLAISGEPEAAANLVRSGVSRGAGTGDRLGAMLSILGDLRRGDAGEELIRGYAAEGDLQDESFASIAASWALDLGRIEFLEEILAKVPEGQPGRAEYLVPICLMTMGSNSPEALRWLDALRSEAPTREETRRARESILAAAEVSRTGEREALNRVVAAGRGSEASLPELLSVTIASLAVGDAVSAKRFALAAEAMDRTLIGGLLLVESQSRQGELMAALDGAATLLETYPGRIEPSLVLLTLWSEAEMVDAPLMNRIRDVTGTSNPLEFAEMVVDAVGLVPTVAPAYAAAAIRQRRTELLEDVVVALIAAGGDAVPAMLQIHDRIAPISPSLAGSLRRRLLELAPSDPRVIALAIDQEGDRDASPARLREALPLDDADPAVRGTAWIVLLSRSSQMAEEEFQRLSAEAIASNPQNLAVLSRILYDPRIWRDAEFSRSVVERVGELRGEESPEFALADANWLLVHDIDNRDARTRSIATLNNLLLADPESFVAGSTLLRLLVADAGGDPQAAIRLGRQLIAARPDATEIYPVVISLLQSQGMMVEAERLLTEFETIDRTGVASARQRAALSFRQGNVEQLVRSLAKLSSSSGNAADALSLGMASEANGDLVTAEASYRRAIEDESLAGAAIVRLGAVLRRLGRLDEFEQVLSDRAGALSEVQREVAMAELMLAGGDVAGAITRLRSLAQRRSGEVAVWTALARACDIADDPRSAGEAAIRGLLLAPDSPELLSIATVSAIEDSDWAETAILPANRSGTLPGVLVEAVRLIRAARSATGRIAPDVAQLRASRELCSRFGDSINAWRLAVAFHQAAGQSAEAKSLAEAASRRFPSEPDPVEWQVNATSSLGELDRAVGLCIEWRRLSFPNVRRVDETQAAIELARDRPDAALPLLNRHRDLIVRDAAIRPGPYRALLAALIMTGAVQDAADLEKSSLSSSEESRATWALIASMAPYQQGIEAMSVLESMSPTDPAARAQLIGRWVSFHERHPSGRGLDRARAILPRTMPAPTTYDTRMATVARADIERVAGDYPAARASLQSVIASYPSSIQGRAKTVGSLSGTAQQELFREIEPLLYARNNLAMLLVEEDRSLDEALSLVEQCVEIIPGNPDLRDTEAQVLLKLGRLSEAEQSALVAIRAYPQNASVLLTGAEILAASGRIDDARQLMQRIRDLVAREPWPSQKIEERMRRVASAIDSQP